MFFSQRNSSARGKDNYQRLSTDPKMFCKSTPIVRHNRNLVQNNSHYDYSSSSLEGTFTTPLNYVGHHRNLSLRKCTSSSVPAKFLPKGVSTMMSPPARPIGKLGSLFNSMKHNVEESFDNSAVESDHDDDESFNLNSTVIDRWVIVLS